LTREEQILKALGISYPTPMEEVLNKIKNIRAGDRVARIIWDWFLVQKQLNFVPWVLDPKSGHYDPIKVARQEIKDELLKELESILRESS